MPPANESLGLAALAFAKSKGLQGRNVKGIQAVRFARLVESARVFSRKSDEEWAAEVAALKDHLREALGVWLNWEIDQYETRYRPRSEIERAFEKEHTEAIALLEEWP